jgi:outer membrane receptor protein involved in Fe transport
MSLIMKYRYSLFSFAILVAVMSLFLTAAIGQTTTTGEVSGVVSDPNGAVVPNAAVTLSGPNLIRPVNTNSDSNGNYRFGSVPPGRYTIETATTSGFAPYRAENVEVNLGRTTTANITLTAAGAVGTVDVIAATPEIDQSSNTTGSNISTEFFSNIPTSRTVQGLYTIAPTVARSGLRDASGRERDPSVAGSSGPENSYILDGINTTDPAFGGGGANLPFEFVQEVEIKTGAYGADLGLSTGGIFNVITKSGGNEFRGDVFAYGLPKNFVRETKNFPFTGIAPNGYSEIDAGFDIGGPIIKNRLTFFGAFNPQYRTNNYLTQTFRREVEGKITTPFYSGKVSWLVNDKHTATFSTFGDFTKEEGHLYGQNLLVVAGFGANPASFMGTRETGGHNYAARVNSNFSQNFIGEFSFGMHFQRNNLIPDESVADVALITDSFAILRGDGTVAPITQTSVLAGTTNTVDGDGVLTPTPGTNTGFIDFVYAPGSSLQRNFVQDGFGLYNDQQRNRWEAAARFQNIFSNHTLKYGFEFYKNSYDISQASTGPNNVFANPLNVAPRNGEDLDNRTVAGFRVTNNWTVCTTRASNIVCPFTNFAPNGDPVASIGQGILAPLVGSGQLPAGITGVVAGDITEDEALNNPFLVRVTTRVRDFQLNAKTYTNVESFYVQDDWKITRNLQLNLGVRWDFQQSYGNGGVSYLKLNSFRDNLQPRLGFSWDPWGKGKTKVFANYARFVETPIPLDINVRAGSEESQTDKNFNVSRVNAPLDSTVATGFGTRNLGAAPTPIDVGLKPQTVNEWTAGIEHELRKNLTFGFRGIYRAQGSVIEDGSFDDGDTYFLFNPGEPLGPGEGGPDGNTEFLACNNPDIGCFGRARRYYRGLEFTLNKRFSNNFAFNSSYVFSSLIGNYEGLFRNDNGQADPNITSLFDLVSLLENTYGRLPNDRPHQFKFNGTYQTPWKLMLSGNFYVQSGTPFNALVPHAVYGDDEGFGVPRGTAIVPDLSDIAGNGGISNAIGSSRTPLTYNLDLGFYYPIKFSETKELRFSVDWFNVLNMQRAITLDNTFQIDSGVEGIPPVSNPFYGSGTVFQYPSALRLGAKFSF